MKLGFLAAKYESCADPGRVSSGYGDLGGISYGAIQFSSNSGNVGAFIDWLKQSADEYRLAIGNELSLYAINSPEFIATWERIGDYNNVLCCPFLDAQMEYGAAVYYRAAADRLIDTLGFDASQRSDALQQVIYSRAVQYSAYWIKDLFEGAAQIVGKELADMSDEELIRDIYQVLINDGEKAYKKDNGMWTSPDDWLNGSRDVVDGLLNRFHRERDDALILLAGGEIE
jgi:hypothetical protein